MTNITESSDIVVDKNWMVIEPFSIYVDDLNSITDTRTTQNWNASLSVVGTIKQGNFPDFMKYSIKIFENKWLLNYDDGYTKNSILIGKTNAPRNPTYLTCNGFYYGFNSHPEEKGVWKTDIKGYRIGDLDREGKRILTVEHIK